VFTEVIVVVVGMVVVVWLVQADTMIMASTMMIDTANESIYFFFIYIPPFYLKTDVQKARTLTIMFSELCKFQFLLRPVI